MKYLWLIALGLASLSHAFHVNLEINENCFGAIHELLLLSHVHMHMSVSPVVCIHAAQTLNLNMPH